MNGRRIGVALALAACTAGGMIGGVAAGGERPVQVTTKLTLDYGGSSGAGSDQRIGIQLDFFGEVKSKEDGCQVRNVSVIDDEFGIRVAKVTSEADGSWEANDVPAQNDRRYYAKVHRKRLDGTNCKKARSEFVVTDVGRAARHTENYKTTLTIKQNDAGSTYKGKARSEIKACQRNRDVTLYEEVDGSPEVRATRTTNKKGKWRVVFIGDGYYAEVAEKVIERNGHKHTCLFDRSPTTPGP